MDAMCLSYVPSTSPRAEFLFISRQKDETVTSQDPAFFNRDSRKKKTASPSVLFLSIRDAVRPNEVSDEKIKLVR